jgi:hypothetical protein
MFTNPDIIHYVFGAGLIILLASLYVIYKFIVEINNSVIDYDYKQHHEERHHDITEQFIKNKFKD